jgi:hypothetical protein
MKIEEMVQNEFDWWQAYSEKDETKIIEATVQRFKPFTEKSEDEIRDAATQYFIPAVYAYMRTKVSDEKEKAWNDAKKHLKKFGEALS